MRIHLTTHIPFPPYHAPAWPGAGAENTLAAHQITIYFPHKHPHTPPLLFPPPFSHPLKSPRKPCRSTTPLAQAQGRMRSPTNMLVLTMSTGEMSVVVTRPVTPLTAK